MNIRKYTQPTIFILVALMLTLVGCGGGGGNDNDTPPDSNPDDTTDPVEETDTSNSISASIWMTSLCKQDSAGTYFHSLVQFTSDGQVLTGWQDFQDSSCSTRASTQLLPSENSGSYTILGSETLQDGTPGYKMNATIDGITNDAYFAITTENKLCFSPNLVLQTVDGSFTGNPTPALDYQNCLSVHSGVDNPNPNPNPNPTPDPDPVTQDTTLEGTTWMTSNCINFNTGYGKIIYQFAGGEITVAKLYYNNANCAGDASSLSEFSSVESAAVYYSGLSSATLPDGTQGYNLRLTSTEGTLDGYYTYGEQSRMCTSYAFDFALVDASNDSLDIDYTNCLIRAHLH
jgi:hypothetical protein